MTESTTNNTTSSFPTICNYTQQQSYASEEESVIFEKTDHPFGPPSSEESRAKRRARQIALGKTPQETKAEELAIMHQTLLKAISNTTVALIKSHTEILKKQYEAYAEEMKAIERKHA